MTSTLEFNGVILDENINSMETVAKQVSELGGIVKKKLLTIGIIGISIESSKENEVKQIQGVTWEPNRQLFAI